MGILTGRSIPRGVDDVEVDQVRPSCHHEWESLGQPCPGTSFADEPLQFRVGPHILRQVMGLPLGNFGPHKKRHSGLKALCHMDKVILAYAREGGSAVCNRYLAC